MTTGVPTENTSSDDRPPPTGNGSSTWGGRRGVSGGGWGVGGEAATGKEGTVRGRRAQHPPTRRRRRRRRQKNTHHRRQLGHAHELAEREAAEEDEPLGARVLPQRRVGVPPVGDEVGPLGPLRDRHGHHGARVAVEDGGENVVEVGMQLVQRLRDEVQALALLEGLRLEEGLREREGRVRGHRVLEGGSEAPHEVSER